MGFFTLLEVATMPVLEVLIISILGAFMATNYWNLLPADARRQMNKIVFVIFTPSLMFASLAKTVTLDDIISWWFMPVNIAISFLIGGILGWIVVKLLKPEPYLEGLVIGSCSAGNLGNLMYIVVPAICLEKGSPFGHINSYCSSIGLAYASFSMSVSELYTRMLLSTLVPRGTYDCWLQLIASWIWITNCFGWVMIQVGGLFIWTHTYYLIRTSSLAYKAMQMAKETVPQIPNNEYDSNAESSLLTRENEDQVAVQVVSSTELYNEQNEVLAIVTQTSPGKLGDVKQSPWDKAVGVLHLIIEELFAPPTVGSILGFLFGATPWLKSLIIGEGAPLRVIQDSVQLLGNGTIPCITLILGGNLTKGLRSARLKPMVIIAVIVVRFMILPVIGICLVKAAGNIGLLPSDPLFSYVLLLQWSIPPAMNIGTMTQLFGVAQEECSVLFLWTYLVASLAITLWSTLYMYILS
ncbi:hypothetical protein MKW94_018200 [Papaver nudicaule]|uniref:Uncharacterized protein n=1 Tax=Papaver nudicaule TaxID=74823 RepID=A0AA41V7J8_PAPNU|nr:hypothetical protein [Papaver nudicaule]